MMTDEDLLRDFVRNRSRGAFEEIVRRHGGLVFGVCRRTLGDLQEAEDAAQSVFLIFLEKASRLGSRTVVAAWLYRTAVFVARNQIRARIRRESRPPLPAEAARDEGRHHLDEGLARLPQRLQDALVVHYLQGKTLTETAAALDCPVKTIEKRVGRGLQRMRELLGSAGVTLSSAALVAFLQSETNASAPEGLQASLQARPLRTPAPRSPLLTLVLPASAALVLVAFVAGTVRLSRQTIATPAKEDGPAGMTARVETAPSPEGSRAGPVPIAPLLFPATFDEFAAKYRKLHQIPESLDLWRAIGIDLRPDELREAYHRDENAPLVIFIPRDDSDPYLVRGFEQWAKRDPRAAADWIFRAFALFPAGEGWKPELSSDDNEQTFLGTVLSTWLARDRKAVEAWIAMLPSGPAAEWATMEYAVQASRQAARPFKELGALVQGMPYSWERVTAVASVAEQWARRDPDAAAAWLERLPFLPGPVSLVNDDEEASLKPLASRLKVDSEGGAGRDHARYFAADRIGRSWAKIDSLAAVRWALGLGDPEESAYALTSIGGVWSLADPAAALRFATAQADATWRTEWIRLAASRLAKDNLGDARAAIALLPSDIRANGYAEVLDQWANGRPREGALEAVRMLTAVGGDQLSVVEGVLSRFSTLWTNEEPAAAAAWASALENPKLREMVCGCVGAAWAQSDPRTALEWIRSLSDGEARARTISAAIDALAPQDLDLARRLLSELKPGNLRLGALSAVAQAWAESAPEAALAWGRALPDAADRSQSVLSVLSEWSLVNADAAKAAAEGLGVELREEGLKMVEDGRLRARREALRKDLLGEKRK